MSSGDLLAVLTRDDHSPPAANGAIRVERNGIKLLAFDDSAASNIGIFQFYVPHFFTASAGINVKYVGMAAAGTTGNVSMDTQIERGGTTQDADSDSFAAAIGNSGNNVSGTSGIRNTFTTALTNAQADGIAAGEVARLKCTLLTASTLSGDWQLETIEIREA